MECNRNNLPNSIARHSAICQCVILIALFTSGCGITLWRGTFSGQLGDKPLEIDIRNMQMIEEPGSRVYYISKASSLAPKVLAVICSQRRFLQTYLGLSPEGHAAAICQAEPQARGYLIAHQPRNWTVWTLKLVNTEELSHAREFNDLYRVFMHELAEKSVVHQTLPDNRDLYDANLQTRWIGDGLAELIAYRFCQQHSDIAALYWLTGRFDALRELSKKWHVESINLRNFLAIRGSISEAKEQLYLMNRYATQTASYYAMSFFYWHSLETEKGAGTIQAFVKGLQSLKDTSNEHIDNLIYQTAGPPYVQRIKHIRVEDAIRLFKNEIELVIPKVRILLKSQSRSIRMAAYEALGDLDEDVFDQILPNDLLTTAIIIDVLPDSPAHEAGLRRNDIIESIDGIPVDDYEDFRQSLSTYNGMTKILRGHSVVELDVDSFEGCRFKAVTR